jgi:arylsulfatase A-like enzyme
MRVLRARLNCDHFIDLRRKNSPDFAAFSTNIVHVAQAHFWKYFEPTSFADTSPDDVERYGSTVHDAYRAIDHFIGKISADVDRDDLVVVVSDHGAEAVAETAARAYGLRTESLLQELRIERVVEATNVGARTFVRMKKGHEGDLRRIRRLFDTARLAEGDVNAFQTRVDEWSNLVVTVEPIVNDRPSDTILFQGGRCRVSDVVRAVESQESSQMRETGALVLAGRGVRPGQRIDGASLLDLVPTLLLLTDLELAADMPGNVIEAALVEPIHEKLPGFVATYEPERRSVSPETDSEVPSADPVSTPPSGG